MPLICMAAVVQVGYITLFWWFSVLHCGFVTTIISGTCVNFLVTRIFEMAHFCWTVGHS